MERRVDLRHAAADLLQEIAQVLLLLLLIRIEHALSEVQRPLARGVLLLRLLPGIDLLAQRGQHHQLTVACAGFGRRDLSRQLGRRLVPATHARTDGS